MYTMCSPFKLKYSSDANDGTQENEQYATCWFLFCCTYPVPYVLNRNKNTHAIGNILHEFELKTNWS